MAIKVLVTNSYNWPIKNVEVTARIIGRDLSTDILKRFPYCAYGLEDSFQSQASGICQMGSLNHQSATTSRDGVAFFNELTFHGGLPGAYHIEFGSYGAQKNASLWVPVAGGVSAILPVPDMADGRGAGTDITFDSSKPAPWPLLGPVPKVSCTRRE